MINQDRWIDSLPKVNSKFTKGANELDPHRWVNTIPVPNPVPKKKYLQFCEKILLNDNFICLWFIICVCIKK